MKISPSLRRLLPLIGAIFLSVAVALGIIEATRSLWNTITKRPWQLR